MQSVNTTAILLPPDGSQAKSLTGITYSDAKAGKVKYVANDSTSLEPEYAKITVSKADNAIKKHKQGQNKAAINILNAFINEVNAQAHKKNDSWAAEKILIYDAEKLIEERQ